MSDENTTAQEPGAGAVEAAEIIGDCIELREKAVAEDGSFPVKLIQPGWGSSGYYSKEVLQRDVPTAFPDGTHMYWNHQTASEEASRPEGDLRDLAAVLVETPHWEESGPYGPGMYSRGKAFGAYKDAVAELAPHIGVSIRAFGSAVKGEAEGRKGRLITELKAGRSVDFVTRPGAGGRVLELFESARGGAPTLPSKEAHEMPDETALQEARAQVAAREATIAERDQTISELRAENAALRERELLAKAGSVVEAALAEAKLPEVTKKRLRGTLVLAAPVTEAGALDEAAFAETISAAVDEAAAEVAAIAGTRVTGMGTGSPQDGKAALKESFKRSYIAQGLPEAEAEKRATDAARGR